MRYGTMAAVGFIAGTLLWATDGRPWWHGAVAWVLACVFLVLGAVGNAWGDEAKRADLYAYPCMGCSRVADLEAQLREERDKARAKQSKASVLGAMREDVA